MSAPFQPAHTPKLEPLSALPIKTLLCLAKIPGEHVMQRWLKPGFILYLGNNLAIEIRYDRNLFEPDGEYQPIISTNYRCNIEDHKTRNNVLDLRFINRIYIVLREHNLDAAGRPTETLLDIYRVPLTEALPL
jgi:hypothetical protein